MWINRLTERGKKRKGGEKESRAGIWVACEIGRKNETVINPIIPFALFNIPLLTRKPFPNWCVVDLFCGARFGGILRLRHATKTSPPATWCDCSIGLLRLTRCRNNGGLEWETVSCLQFGIVHELEMTQPSHHQAELADRMNSWQSSGIGELRRVWEIKEILWIIWANEI